ELSHSMIELRTSSPHGCQSSLATEHGRRALRPTSLGSRTNNVKTTESSFWRWWRPSFATIRQKPYLCHFGGITNSNPPDLRAISTNHHEQSQPTPQGSGQAPRAAAARKTRPL